MNFAWTVEFAEEAEHDLALIFDHLFETYQDLGEPDETAFEHASARIRGIRESAVDLVSNPYQGTRREAIDPNLRNITINKAIIWFHVEEKRQVIHVLAFFFGGQDYVRHMLRRILEAKLRDAS